MSIILNHINKYNTFLEQLSKIYDLMDREYNQASDYYGFECKGCKDNCCETRFYHHTYLEYFYILKAYNRLDPQRQSEIISKAVNVCKKLTDADQKGIKIRLMCPFNFNDLCIIYEYRPMICRLHGIAHEFNRPGIGIIRGHGCESFTQNCSTKEYYKFDRTQIYIKMAQLESQLKQTVNIRDKIKMTVAEMIISLNTLNFKNSI